MTFFNTGKLTASKPFTEQAKAIIKEVLGEPNEWFTIRDRELEFAKYPSGSLDTVIDNFVDILEKLDILLEGRVDYDGSYQGAYLWKNGEKHTELEQEDVAIMDAGDQTLINELERRGYNVTGLRIAACQSLEGINEANRGFAEATFKLPLSDSERSWLAERLTTLSAKETLALAAGTIGGYPKSAVEAINLLISLPDYCVCLSASNYEDLGLLYLAYEGIALPDTALEHTDLYELGIRFENKWPGIYIGDCYVMYPEAPLSSAYDGYNPATLRDNWSVKVKLTAKDKVDGVWLRLPDYSDPNSIAGLQEVEVALSELGVKELGECRIVEARCVLPEAGNLVEQYSSIEELLSDGNDLGAMLDIGGGVEQIRAKVAAINGTADCTTLRGILAAMSENEFVTNDELEEFARNELRNHGMPDEMIDEGIVGLQAFARDELKEQGYQFSEATGIFRRPKAAEPEQTAAASPLSQM